MKKLNKNQEKLIDDFKKQDKALKKLVNKNYLKN